jgi:hypothetical protein
LYLKYLKALQRKILYGLRLNVAMGKEYLKGLQVHILIHTH